MNFRRIITFILKLFDFFCSDAYDNISTIYIIDRLLYTKNLGTLYICQC